jgi:hypothetical protein
MGRLRDFKMAVYQFRFTNGSTLKDWALRMAARLEPAIPSHLWPKKYDTRDVRVLVLCKALRAGLLSRLSSYDLCGSQAQCDEACQLADESQSGDAGVDNAVQAPVERYQVVAIRDSREFAEKLLESVLDRVPDAVAAARPLMEELLSGVSRHLCVNELCGLTDLCGFIAPQDLLLDWSLGHLPDDV